VTLGGVSGVAVVRPAASLVGGHPVQGAGAGCQSGGEQQVVEVGCGCGLGDVSGGQVALDQVQVSCWLQSCSEHEDRGPMGLCGMCRRTGDMMRTPESVRTSLRLCQSALPQPYEVLCDVPSSPTGARPYCPESLRLCR
jgi:hypothetical protein